MARKELPLIPSEDSDLTEDDATTDYFDGDKEPSEIIVRSAESPPPVRRRQSTRTSTTQEGQ